MATSLEEPEPQLKYELLGGDVQSILGNEKITCMNVSEKILAIGTEQGRVHVLDYSGNQVRLLNLHKSRVNDLSFDKEAEHIASASNDCSVVVTNLYTDQITRHEFRLPIKAVAIDPRPITSVRKTWRDLVTGNVDGEVTLHTQGWLARADQPLGAASSRDVAAGGVLAVKWSGTLVAWAYDSSVSVYDSISHQTIRTLRRDDPRAPAPATVRGTPPPKSPPPKQHPADRPAPAASANAAAVAASSPAAAKSPGVTVGGTEVLTEGATGIRSLRRCSLLFAPDSHLYVAWSDTVLVARIWTVENSVGSLWPQVDLVARMKLGEAVLGVSPYGDSDLAVLVYPSGLPPSASADSTLQQSQLGCQRKLQNGGRDDDTTKTQDSSPPPPPAPAPAQQQQEQPGRQQGQQLQHQQDSKPREGNDALGGVRSARTPDREGSVCPESSSTESGDAPSPSSSPATRNERRGETLAEGDGATRTVAATTAASLERAAELPLPSPPDPLAPGRTPQLVILGRSDHREWARDSVPLPGADSCGPADYLGLMPSLPHHLHLPATAVDPEAAAALGGAFGSLASMAVAAAAAAVASTATPRPAATGRESSGGAGGGGSGGSGGRASCAVSDSSRGSGGGGGVALSPSAAESTQTTSIPSTPASTAKAGHSTTTSAAAAAAAVTAPSARRLVPVWVDGQELIFFIAAPMEIATARSRDSNDRVNWLLARRRWEEALSVVEEAPQGLPPGLYDRVVNGYIEELLTTQSYDKAVELSARLLKDDATRWEHWVYLFAQARQLPKLVGELPTHNPRLRSQVYDMALQSLLLNPADHPTLVSLVHTWPTGCYSLAALADAVAARLRRLQHQHPQSQPPNMVVAPGAATATAASGTTVTDAGGSGVGSDSLWQLLAWLYEQQGRPDLALSIHLRLKSPSVFIFVNHHGLQANLLGRAPDLFSVDEKAALALLTCHVDALPPANVVPSLQEAMRSAPSPAAAEVWRRRLFAYLQALFAADSSVGADYHDLQVSLTAEYQPSKLMDMLVSSQYYSLEAALAICEARGLVSEQVFVLGRMGNADQALRLIIDRLGDIPRAIDFVVGQRDDELWGRLIDWALGSSETTGALLDCIGGYVDPLLLVRRIPRGMRVERLRDRLRAIIADYRTQTSFREGCNAILRSDCRHLLSKLYDGTRRALPFLYVMRPEGGVDGGRWYRCDVVHGGKLQAVSAAEVPEEALFGFGSYRPLGPSGAAAKSGSPTSSPSPSAAPAAAATAAASNSLHSDLYRVRGSSGVGGVVLGRGSATNLSSSVPSASMMAAAERIALTRGSSLPVLDRSGAAVAPAKEHFPWWAQSGGLDVGGVTRGSSGLAAMADLWVGFNLPSGRARLTSGEETPQHLVGGFRRSGPYGRPGPGQAAVVPGGTPNGAALAEWRIAAVNGAPMTPVGVPSSPALGSGLGVIPPGSGPGPRALGSLWQHVATRI
ncbi:hypothetical protein VaNZ11_002165 [Volvox africanus]|uniref:Vps41 beta-propeller domain-containing protein n=1 Tax=Volvox africanus TaxID=51714 RepID=A0ABQ5RRG3_9CHLO|nr:hypothetical protein VaNZ11_002165 [Volvox africanus]